MLKRRCTCGVQINVRVQPCTTFLLTNYYSLVLTSRHNTMPNSSSLDAPFVLVDNERQDTTSPPVAHEKVAEVEAKDRSPTLPLTHPSNNHPGIPGSIPSYAHDWLRNGTGRLRRRTTFRRRLRSRLQLTRGEPLGVFGEPSRP